VIVTIENFGSNLVGAYGNSICPTPNIDRFASRSLIADQFWMDGCTVPHVLASMWSGKHLVRRLGNQSFHGLGDDRRSNVETVLQSPGLLITDSPVALEIGKKLLSGEAMLASAPEEGQTAFASLISQSFEQWIPEIESLPWLWIHSRGLGREWDAPYEYRCSLCGEEDPLPPRETAPPSAWVDKHTDPDVIFGWSCGAGAQAMVVDEVWEWMESALEQLEIAPSCLLALAGVLGFPLGEHHRVGYPEFSEQLGAPKSQNREAIGSHATILHSEMLHTPLILRPGDSLPLGVRFAPFLQPHHLGRIVDSWIEKHGWQAERDDPLPSESTFVEIEQLVAISSLRRDAWPAPMRATLAIDGSQTALNVPAWGAAWDGTEGDDGQQGALFAMPDDRWQQNEIRSRAPEVLEQMRLVRDAWMTDSGESPSNIDTILSRMDDSLWRPFR
jgi:hypothetical protein